MKGQSMTCPAGHGKMALKKITRETTFRGVDLKYPTEAFVCETCGLEAGTIEQAGAEQKAIADGYRKVKSLLTGEEIKSMRTKAGLTQQALADKVGAGIASIKRWEKGLLQNEAMDRALRRALQNDDSRDIYSGNRKLSLPRVKLVIRCVEKATGCSLLKSKKLDRLLYTGKYLFYADMLAYKKNGKGMTGATYAVLPYGPQLNNYTDLVDLIKAADETTAEPLTAQEQEIITTIARAYPTPRSVYEAAHREAVWKKQAIGTLMLYTDAIQLTQI